MTLARTVADKEQESMHRILRLFVLSLVVGVQAGVGALATGPAYPAAAREADAREADCRRFVQKFYDWYVDGPRKQIGFEMAIAKKPGSFSRELLRGLREDAAAQRKSPGELVGLEFDPFLNSQDTAERYQVGKVIRKGGRFLAEVYAHYRGGNKPMQPAVVAELRSERGRWVFVNFHYGKGKTESKNENLLSVLAVLRKDRAKGK
jgi:hypothetical protein